MLDVINNALKNEDYYICLYQNKVYIYNYIEITNFNNNMIKVSIKNNFIKINGKSLHIKKMVNHELLIEGIISGVSYE